MEMSEQCIRNLVPGHYVPRTNSIYKEMLMIQFDPKKGSNGDKYSFVNYLFDHLSIAAEDSQWCASVVRSDVIFLSAAHFHRKEMSLFTRQPEIQSIVLLDKVFLFFFT